MYTCTVMYVSERQSGSVDIDCCAISRWKLLLIGVKGASVHQVFGIIALISN